MKNYTFIIQFLEGYEEDCSIVVNDNNTVDCPLTLVERKFSCEASTYERARAKALDFAQKALRDFYEPLNVWAAFRLCRGEEVE